jgi:hypothetical protein
MAFKDVIQDHFNAADEAAFDAAVAAIAAVLQNKLRNLNEEENRSFGFIKEKAKLLVDKVADYRDTQPQLSSGDVDWVEFKADRFDRRFLETGVQKLINLVKPMLETKRLHDYDNYQSALLDKRYTAYKKKTSPGMGYDSKDAELSAFFKKSKKKKASGSH